MTSLGSNVGAFREVTITVNGRKVTANVDTRTLLVEFLRETAGLTGTHVGCDTSQCGACVVEFDGDSVKSCTILAVQADTGTVKTIEALGTTEALHPMQEAFTEHHALQCGFCTPGLLTTAHALLQENPRPAREQIREAIAGNLCRCTGYIPIVDAIEAAAQSGNASGQGTPGGPR